MATNDEPHVSRQSQLDSIPSSTVAAQVSADVALRRLEGGRLSRGVSALLRFLRRVVAGRRREQPTGIAKLPRLEVVHLPHYRVTFDVSQGHNQTSVEMLVNCHTGEVCRCASEHFASAEAVEPERPVPHLPIEEAVRRARAEVLRLLISNAWRSPKLSDGGRVALVHYPYWVRYFECRDCRIDFAMLDAVTGQRVGPQYKLALLKQFSDARPAPAGASSGSPHAIPVEADHGPCESRATHFS